MNYEILFYVAVAIIAFGFYLFLARDEALREQFIEDMKVDHLRTADAMLHCSRNDCERLIDAFYDRWSGIIDEWELSNRTAALYKRIIETQKTRDEMEKRRNSHNQ